MLTLTGTNIIVNSDVWLDTGSAPIAANIIFVDASAGTNVTWNVGKLFIDGTESIPVRSTTSGAMMSGLAVVNDQLLLTTVSAVGQSDDLVWRGGNSIWDETSTNWSGTVNGVHVTTFLNGDDVFFINDAVITDRRVAITPGGVAVGTMTVSGTGYTFDLTQGDITGTGNINFGTSTLECVLGTAITSTGGTIVLATGSTLALDLTGANNTTAIVTLTGTNVTVNSNIRIASLPTLAGGQSILLVNCFYRKH
jgi:hypothetical protein